jgi:hypothetical protein
VSVQDPEAEGYVRRLGTNAGEIVAAGASLALRESATVVDLAAAAVWRWEHPSIHDDARQKDLQEIRPDKVYEDALRRWVDSAQNDNGLNVMRTRRDRLTNRAPIRGIAGRVQGHIYFGPQGQPGDPRSSPEHLPLPPVKLDGVPVDEIAGQAVSLVSHWYLKLIQVIRGLP